MTSTHDDTPVADAYDKGFQACLDGEYSRANPYPADDPQHDNWQDGWDVAWERNHKPGECIS